MSAWKVPTLTLVGAFALAACGDSNGSQGKVDGGGTEQDSGKIAIERDSGDDDDDYPDAGHVAQQDAAAPETLTGCAAIKLDPPTDGIQYEMPLTVPAAHEREYCMLVLLDQDLNLNWSDGRFTPGSHHALVHRTSYTGTIPTKTITGDDFPNADQPHPCPTPTALWDSQGVIADGRSTAIADKVGNDIGRKGSFPDDVAYRLKKGEVLLVNFHMINTTEQPIDSCYKINLHGVPSKQVKQEAGTIFFYNSAITVPANGTATAQMACPVTKSVNLAMSVSHMHSRGDGYWANLLDKSPTDATAKVVTELYKGKVWEDPKAKLFSPPQALKAGQWIEYQCHYTNHENRNVAQGYASTDEMCMFIGTYWPRDLNLEFCSVPNGTLGSNGIEYGSGTKAGADFLQCFWESPQVFTGTGDNPDRYKTLSCETQTCPKASVGQTPYITCLAGKTKSCKADCADAQASFQAECATTPDLCGDKYGDPNLSGAGGTCYKDTLTPTATAQAPAIAACTKDSQVNEYVKQCEANQCKTACTTSADACNKCLGTFDGDQNNPACLNQLILPCVADQAQKLTTACVTDCFTDCITTLQTSCVVDCLNDVECKTEYDTLATATCN